MMNKYEMKMEASAALGEQSTLRAKKDLTEIKTRPCLIGRKHRSSTTIP